MNKEEFINEFNDWTKEEILGRAFEICCKNIELKEIEKEHQKLKENLKATNKGLKKIILKRKKWKHRYQLAKHEIKELKKQLEEYKYSHSCSFVDTCKNVTIANYNQQKEFIEYMNKTIEELECDDVDDEEMKGYLIQRIDTFKEILSKYKEIIGDKQ